MIAVYLGKGEFECELPGPMLRLDGCEVVLSDVSVDLIDKLCAAVHYRIDEAEAGDIDSMVAGLPRGQ